MRYYSQQTGCTYLSAIHGEQMPSDAVPISDALFQSVIANPEQGKVRSHSNGLPVLIEAPRESSINVVEQERKWRDSELSAVSWLRDRHRDQLDFGSSTALTTEQFNELLGYMQALRDWPQSEVFPDIGQRPVAPLWIADQTQ
jgi:hypothetical protein